MTSAQRAAWLTANRAVWGMALAVWAVVLAAGTYLGKIDLRPAGALALAVTSALGLAYLVATSQHWRRGLGILANGTLLVELGLLAARRGDATSPRTLLGLLVAVVVLGVPLLLLAVAPDDRD